MKTPSLCFYFCLAVHVLACGSSKAPPEPSSTSAEPLEGDCSGALGDCYIACQNVTPSPTEGCFTRCDTQFMKCIRPTPVEEVEQ